MASKNIYENILVKFTNKIIIYVKDRGHIVTNSVLLNSTKISISKINEDNAKEKRREK